MTNFWRTPWNVLNLYTGGMTLKTAEERLVKVVTNLSWLSDITDFLNGKGVINCINQGSCKVNVSKWNLFSSYLNFSIIWKNAWNQFFHYVKCKFHNISIWSICILRRFGIYTTCLLLETIREKTCKTFIGFQIYKFPTQNMYFYLKFREVKADLETWRTIRILTWLTLAPFDLLTHSNVNSITEMSSRASWYSPWN